jgi:two-component system, NtrC family, response regulator GlrR
MRKPTALLLDLHPSSDLAADLTRVLRSALDMNVEVGSEENVRSQYAKKAWADALPPREPCVIYLLWSSDTLPEARQLLEQIRATSPRARVVAVTQDATEAGWLDLLNAGAVDLISHPFDTESLRSQVQRLLEPVSEGEALLCEMKQRFGLRGFVGRSPSFLDEINKIPLLAKCNSSVLITGETGTGKELCARAIHYLSARAGKPFVPINCGAIPLDLVENELFGHERGAFTGAVTSQTGLILEANGGTLLIDEVDCLPLVAQVKLLRFLQEKEYRPLGSSKTRRADVRVLAATNTSLEDAIKAGRLREDLYFRLNVIPLRMPPLRERLEDVPLLAEHFLAKYAAELGKELNGFAPAAVHSLLAHSWPGNVRELEHVVERAAVLARGPSIELGDVVVAGLEGGPQIESLQEAKARLVARFEKSYIQSLLIAYKGNITRAAEAAKKNRRAFFQLIRKYGIDVAKFKQTNLYRER